MRSFFRFFCRVGLLSVLLLALPLGALAAKPRHGYIPLSETRKLYYRYFPGHPSKPTLLLVNGLVQPLALWDLFSAQAQAQGYTVLQFAFSAHPESLRGLPRYTEPDFFRTGLELSDLTDEILAVYKAFKRTGKVDLVAFSYGSVAIDFAHRYRELVNRVVLISPLVEPIKQYDPSGELLDFYMSGWKAATRVPTYGAYSRLWYDVTWNVIHSNFMRTRDPDYVPEGVDQAIYRKAAFHLLRAVRNFNLRDYVKRPLPPVHLMVASGEMQGELSQQLSTWESLPPVSRGTLAYFDGAFRNLPEVHPVECAGWLDQILEQRSNAERSTSYLVSLYSQDATRWSYPKLKKAIELSLRR